LNADFYDFVHHDPLNGHVLVSYEVAQRRETGYDVSEAVATANAIDPSDNAALLALVDQMDELPRLDGWAYEEPTALDDIIATLPPPPAAQPVAEPVLADKIHAAWLGRIAGCNIGKPVERGDHWTVERIRDYLTMAEAYPLRDYVPLLDPMPDGFELRESWPETTRGNVDGSARDDDIDYTILTLHLLEKHGSELRPDVVGEAWLNLFPLEQVFTAERAAYVNMVHGCTPPQTATRRNPFREWIGALIRGDAFGYAFAGDPLAAAVLSYQDASLSHVGNGIYGEMWAAALVAAAFTAEDAHEAIEASLAVVPPRSRLATAITHVRALHASGITWEQALTEIRATYGHYSWVHTINNAAAITAALLWSDGDYATAVGQVVMSGWDTDSNGATVGSVAAIIAGRQGLPVHLIDPLHDQTRSALFGFDGSAISNLADRTVRLAVRGLT
jgi:ADP-ribosylglycohydrolase